VLQVAGLRYQASGGLLKHLRIFLRPATCSLPTNFPSSAFPFTHGWRARKPFLTSVKLQATVSLVRIRNFTHKGLKRLYAEDIAKGVPPNTADKLRKMFAFLDDMQDAEELQSLPAWKAHILTGDRTGTWSLSVTRNRRLTFRMDRAENEICDINLEDYH
jgi:toxin HigB-1